MKLFVARYYNESDSSQGSEWFSSKKAAEKSLADFTKREDINFDADRSGVDAYIFRLTKKDVLALLNMVAVHPDNG